MDKVINIMDDSGLKAKIVILDACRKEFKTGSRGFSSIAFAPQFAPKGTLIYYSTSLEKVPKMEWAITKATTPPHFY